MERSESEDDLFNLLTTGGESPLSAGSAAMQSDTSSVSSRSTSASSASSATASSEDHDDVPFDGSGGNGNADEEDSGSISESVSTFIDDEEFSCCVKRSIARADINFTNAARAAFLRTWMESDDFWLEHLSASQLIFLEKLLKLDRISPLEQ